MRNTQDVADIWQIFAGDGCMPYVDIALESPEEIREIMLKTGGNSFLGLTRTGEEPLTYSPGLLLRRALREEMVGEDWRDLSIRELLVLQRNGQL